MKSEKGKTGRRKDRKEILKGGRKKGKTERNKQSKREEDHEDRGKKIGKEE